jgi:hypothetical protein
MSGFIRAQGQKMIDSVLSSTDSTYKRRLFISVCLVIVSAVTLIVLLPTMFWIFLGPGVDSLFMQEVHKISSPDDRYEMVVSRRVNFPVFDPFSPSITARIDLKRTGSYGALNYVQFEIHEYSELRKPEVVWTGSHMRVDKIDWHDEHSFIVRLPEL